MENVVKIFVVLLFGYLGWSAYESWKNNSLTLPLISDDPEPSPANPDELAQQFHKYFIEQKGFRAVIHPDTIHDRDVMIARASALNNDALKALYAAYNKRYTGEAKGTLTRIINDAAGDPFDKYNSKSSLVKKLRALNCN